MGSVAFLSPDIPTKIYLAIAEHFLLSPIVALTLASKRLAHIYGIKVRDNLRVDRHERRDVFLLRERDLPGYYLAYAEDAKLTQQLAFYAYLKFSNEQSWLRSGSIDLHRFDYELAWYRLLRALKRGRCGHEHCLPLDEFKHSKSHSVLAENIGYQIDLSAEAKIVGGRVLLRSTHNITHETTMTYTELQNLKISLCRHVGTDCGRWPWYDNSLAHKLSAPRFTEWDGDDDDNDRDDAADIEELLDLAKAEDIFRGCCSFCMTDWDVSSSDTAGSYIITRWQNLGNGDSNGLDDELKCSLNNTIWEAFAGGYKLRSFVILNYPQGCVRDAFENGNGSELAVIKAALMGV